MDAGGGRRGHTPCRASSRRTPIDRWQRCSRSSGPVDVFSQCLSTKTHILNSSELGVSSTWERFLFLSPGPPQAVAIRRLLDRRTHHTLPPRGFPSNQILTPHHQLGSRRHDGCIIRFLYATTCTAAILPRDRVVLMILRSYTVPHV